MIVHWKDKHDIFFSTTPGISIETVKCKSKDLNKIDKEHFGVQQACGGNEWMWSIS